MPLYVGGGLPAVSYHFDCIHVHGRSIVLLLQQDSNLLIAGLHLHLLGIIPRILGRWQGLTSITNLSTKAVKHILRWMTPFSITCTGGTLTSGTARDAVYRLLIFILLLPRRVRIEHFVIEWLAFDVDDRSWASSLYLLDQWILLEMVDRGPAAPLRDILTDQGRLRGQDQIDVAICGQIGVLLLLLNEDGAHRRFGTGDACPARKTSLLLLHILHLEQSLFHALPALSQILALSLIESLQLRVLVFTGDSLRLYFLYD